MVVESHLSELVNHNQRLRKLRRAQRGVDERRLPAPEEPGDEGNRNSTLDVGWRDFNSHRRPSSKHFATWEAARNQAIRREVRDDLASVLRDHHLLLYPRGARTVVGALPRLEGEDHAFD